MGLTRLCIQKKVAPDGSQSAGGSMNDNKMMRYEFKIDIMPKNLNKKARSESHLTKRAGERAEPGNR